MKDYTINFYDHYSSCGPTLVAGGILFKITSFHAIFLLFVYILKFFCWKTNMVGLDF